MSDSAMRERKWRILQASNYGLDYLLQAFPYEFSPLNKKEWQNKGKRKVSITYVESHRKWFATDWTDSEKGKDIFTVAAEKHGLTTYGADFLSVLEILECDYSISNTSTGSGSTAISPKYLDLPAPREDIPYKPNAGKKPKYSYSYVPSSKTNLRDAVFGKWFIDPDTLDRYQVTQALSITKLDDNPRKRRVTQASKDRPLFIFENGANKKVYSPRPLWTNGPKTLYLQSSGNYVFGYDQLPEQCEGIVFAAGQKDTLALNAMLNDQGIYAVCLNSESQAIPKELFADFQSRAQWIAVCYDNDTTGILSAWKAAIAFPIKWLTFDHGINDVCDWLEAKQDPKGFAQFLIDQAQTVEPIGVRESLAQLAQIFYLYFSSLAGTEKEYQIWDGRDRTKEGICRYLEANFSKDFPKEIARAIKGIKHHEIQENHSPTCACRSCENGSSLDTIELTARKLPKSASKGRMTVLDYSPEFIKKLEEEAAATADKLTPWDWMKINRKKNKFEARKLRLLAQACEDVESRLIIRKISNKKTLCSFFFAGRELPTKEILRVGQNYCKHKACPICSYIVSRERKKAVLEYFKLNRAIWQSHKNIKTIFAALFQIIKNAPEDYLDINYFHQELAALSTSKEETEHENHISSASALRPSSGTGAVCSDEGCDFLRHFFLKKVASKEKRELEKSTLIEEFTKEKDETILKALSKAFQLEQKQIEKHLNLEINKYHFYHLGLTLQHDQHNRNGDYSKELQDNFKWLRDSQKTWMYVDSSEECTETGKIDRNHQRRTGEKKYFTPTGREVVKIQNNRKFWKEHVKGGFYSMEVIANQSDNPNDHSMHIHLHTLIMSEKELEKTEFIEEVRERWKAKSGGDSDQVQLERAYRLDENRNKIYHYPDQDSEDGVDSADALDRVLSETCKYSLKMDFEGVGADAETLASLFAPGKRYFGFFGDLYGRGITNFNYADINDVQLTDTEIFSPSTGEIFKQGETSISVTNINNVRFRPINSYPTFEYIDHRKKIRVNMQQLPAELGGMTKQEFSRRLREKAEGKIRDYEKEAEACKDEEEKKNLIADIAPWQALLEEITFTGTLFLMNDDGSWTSTLSDPQQEILDDKEKAKDLVERKEFVQVIETMWPRLKLGAPWLTATDKSRMEEVIVNAEAMLGISRHMIKTKYDENPRYKDQPLSIQRQLYFEDEIAPFRGYERKPENNIIRLTDNDLLAMYIETNKSYLEVMPDRYAYKMHKAAKGFDRIEIDRKELKFFVDEAESYEEAHLLGIDYTEPVGCKMIELIGIQHEFMIERFRQQQKIENPPSLDQLRHTLPGIGDVPF